MNNKILITLSALLTFTGVTYAYINMPDLIDKMNEQKITYQIEQKSLQEDNKTLREQRKALDKKITYNSNKWNNLNGKIQMIDETIRVIENEGLDQ